MALNTTTIKKSLISGIKSATIILTVLGAYVYENPDVLKYVPAKYVVAVPIISMLAKLAWQANKHGLITKK